MQKLFDNIPLDVPLLLVLNSPNKDIKGFVINKIKHSDYSYRLFVVSLDKKYGGYYWIKPGWTTYSNKRVIDFKLL